MLSDLQRANISAMFDALNASADGTLDRDDFVLRANQMCAALAPDETSHHRHALQAAYGQAWEELRQAADVNDDGSISRAEYLSAMEKGMIGDPDYLDRAVLCVSRALFEASDTDADGVLSREEYVKMFAAIDLDAEMAGAGFDHIDSNGDGSISYDEFLAALHGLFSSADPDGPGAKVLR